MATPSPTTQSGLVRALKRYGAKAGIIAVGAAIAIGSLEQTRFLPKPTIVQHPFADVASGRATAGDSANRPWNVLGQNVEHDRIAYWMNKLTTTARGGVETALGRKSKYDDMIAAKLEERHMPADLIYLAMIESEFNPTATSRVKAKGLWQFMAATARQFGLVVRGKTDERVDPEKATDAALTYLDALHNQFGSWYLAAAAYNSGGGTVRKALREVTGKTTGTDSDFFRILPRLPKETQDYVPKLIATARVGNDPARYGLTVHESGGEVSPLTPLPLVVDSAKLKPATAAATTTARNATSKSTATRKTTAKRSTTKKSTAKKTSTKKSTATRKSSTRKPTTKRSTTRR
jgi:soluble lytic murein transglycosylase-like protein